MKRTASSHTNETYRSQSTSGNVHRIARAGKVASRQGKAAAKDLRRAAYYIRHWWD